MKLIKPCKLNLGDTIGFFTPSAPAYSLNPELFKRAVKKVSELGLKVELGFLTGQDKNQGYRSGTAQDRAKEFMQLIDQPQIKVLMATIGGANSSSMIPYLDFKKIRQSRKIICGYSDITSLHLSILKYAGLKTFYGPALMTTFGEPIKENIESFLKASSDSSNYPRQIKPFPKWSSHFRRWDNGDWKNIKRKWKDNLGWKVLNAGEVKAEIIIANLNTLVSTAGTEYFPDLEGKILLIEEMKAPWSQEERSFRQLDLMSVFDKISGLIMGKPEHPNNQGADFTLEDLLMEVVGKRNYPIVSDFDCSHTLPMHSLCESSLVHLKAQPPYEVFFELQESFVEDI